MKKNRVSELQVSGMKAASAMKSGIEGTVRMASVIICKTLSIQPPK